MLKVLLRNQRRKFIKVTITQQDWLKLLVTERWSQGRLRRSENYMTEEITLHEENTPQLEAF